MSKITVPLSATGTELVCEDPDVRILSKTVGVYYIKLTLDAYWTDGEENILLVMKKKNENLSTVLEYSVGEVRSGADKEIPTALLETEGKISVWVGKTPSSGEQMLSGVLELTVEPSGGIIEEGDICVKTPLSENAVEKVRQVNGVFQYNASHEWKALAGQNEVDEELAKKVDKVEGKDLSTNDYTDGDKAEVEKVANKVDKVDGKGLSTNDFTDEDKAEVEKVANKVDKVEGKGLSTNDYTNYDKQFVNEVLPASVNENAAAIDEIRLQKVDKIEGKGLSTNDYTDEDKQIVNDTLPAMINFNSQIITTLSEQKVDKIEGKGLSTNDYTDGDKTEVAKVANKADISNPLSLSDAYRKSSGFVIHDYTSSTGAEKYVLNPKDGFTLTDTDVGKTRVPSSYAVAQYVKTSVANKVDKIEGKGLSTNDYTDEDKAEVAKIANKVDKPSQKGILSNESAVGVITLVKSTTMPEEPSDYMIPTTKLLKDYVEDNSHPLQLSDTDKTKSLVLIQHNYDSETQTEKYIARSIDTNNLSESGLAAFNIPTSKAVISWVKAYIESLNLNGGA